VWRLEYLQVSFTGPFPASYPEKIRFCHEGQNRLVSECIGDLGEDELGNEGNLHGKVLTPGLSCLSLGGKAGLQTLTVEARLDEGSYIDGVEVMLHQGLYGDYVLISVLDHRESATTFTSLHSLTVSGPHWAPLPIGKPEKWVDLNGPSYSTSHHDHFA
jgi:hypothetical protein